MTSQTPPQLGMTRRRYDLTPVAEGWWKKRAFNRYSLVGLAGFFGVLSIVTGLEAFSHPAAWWKPVAFAGGACVVGWTASWFFTPAPIALDLDRDTATFCYESGKRLELRWADPDMLAFLRDARGRTKWRERSIGFDTCLEKANGEIVAPLTAEAFDALIASARTAHASIEQFPQMGGALGVVLRVSHGWESPAVATQGA